ncbi:MAG TPA: metal-sensitive transcriptional regulator [Actinomycetota bacterium]
MGDNHDGILKRLRRIEGQVSGIRKMQEDGRYCIDVLDQISAARAGLEAVALLILEDHVNGCVREAIEEGKGEEKAVELLEAVGRFARSV